MTRTNIAVFASGSGSTAEAFIRDAHTRQYPFDVKLIITNNSDAFVLERVKNLNAELGLQMETAIVNSHTQPTAKSVVHGQQTEEEQAAILALLSQYNVDLVLLLGYMKRVGQKLLNEYGWLPSYTSIYQARMLNTHPGLLPQTIGTHGRGTQEFTLTEGMTEAGQTLHAVAAEYDTGPHAAEHRVAVMPDDTPDTLFARVQETEKEHLAADVLAFVEAQQVFRKEE